MKPENIFLFAISAIMALAIIGCSPDGAGSEGAGPGNSESIAAPESGTAAADENSGEAGGETLTPEEITNPPEPQADDSETQEQAETSSPEEGIPENLPLEEEVAEPNTQPAEQLPEGFVPESVASGGDGPQDE